MKQHFLAFAHDVDAFCAKLNDGLTAVAMLLAIAVAAMAIFRAEEAFPDLLVSIPVDMQARMVE